jgi:Reverse transcriptase (RNA-dependent DNA polymerase)
MPAKWVTRYESKPGRWVFNPSAEARLEGREIKSVVEGHWQAPSYYYHLRRGGHVAALRQHQKHTHFFKVDIADFFGSISRSRLARALKGYVAHVEARRLATASTVRRPDDDTRTMIPYGFVQSPLLASLVLHKSSLGAYLDTLHKDKRLQVTVYVDDIIVSSSQLERLQAVSSELRAKVAKAGFSLNLAKDEDPATSITAFNIELRAGEELTIV